MKSLIRRKTPRRPRVLGGCFAARFVSVVKGVEGRGRYPKHESLNVRYMTDCSTDTYVRTVTKMSVSSVHMPADEPSTYITFEAARASECKKLISLSRVSNKEYVSEYVFIHDDMMIDSCAHVTMCKVTDFRLYSRFFHIYQCSKVILVFKGASTF